MVRLHLYEKFLDYCSWEHEIQGETVATALEQFLSDKDIKPHPVKVKKKEKAGVAQKNVKGA